MSDTQDQTPPQNVTDKPDASAPSDTSCCSNLLVRKHGLACLIVGVLLIGAGILLSPRQLGSWFSADGVISIAWKRVLIRMAQAALLFAGSCGILRRNLLADLLRAMARNLPVLLAVSVGIIAGLGRLLAVFPLCLLLPVLFVLLIADAVLVGRYHWIKPSALRKLAAPTVAFLASALLCFMLLETYAFLHVESDGFGVSLRGQKWMRTYWNPITPDEYRDVPHSPQQLAHKRVIFVVGDSFAGGHGINAINDRFAEQMQQQLGNDYETCVLAKCGLDTRAETQALQTAYAGVKPEVVILGYFLNDIDVAASDAGMTYGIKQPPMWIQPVLKHSYFVDLVWYRLIQSLVAGQSNYLDFLQGLYEAPAVWQAHRADIRNFVQACRERGGEQVRTIVVVFPVLTAVEATAPITAKVTEAFREDGAEVLDLAPVLRGRAASELIVSPYDAHPSIALHAEVGKLLADVLQHQ